MVISGIGNYLRNMSRLMFMLVIMRRKEKIALYKRMENRIHTAL